MYGIHRNFISLLEDMYMESKLSICLPSGTTHFFPSSIGLKQGCNLYADDLVLISETKNGLQQCLNKLQKY